MNFYYWSPFLSNVATVKAVLNSAISIKKYSRQINPYIINVVGEWNSFENEIKLNKVKTISFNKNINLYKNLPRYTFLKSRFSYFLISLMSVIKLYRFLSTKKETDYIILHLITSLPLILLLFFNFKCKFVLRISGFPKLTILRKFLWKLSSKKLHKVSTPTKDTMNMLINKNIFQSNMICLVRDPIINISEINLKIREKIFENLEDKKYIINVGRLTKQKNQEFLIDGFKILKEKFPNLKLIILGEGELETKLINKSKKMNLQNDIKFLGFKDNVYKYYRRSICFTLTSAWEDPGFVLIEAAASKIPIISSDCNNGPKEFIKSNYNGYLYKNHDLNSFIQTFENFIFDLENEKNKINLKIYNAFKEVKNYTKFNHYKELVKMI